MQFTSQQQAVIDSWGQGLAVWAGAGCGKTSTLVAKCEALVRKNPDARFAAVSFTERSTRDLQERLSLLFPLQGNLGSHWVLTIHGLCGAILQDFPKESGFEGDETILNEGEAEKLWERALEKLWFSLKKPEISQSLERLLVRETRTSLLDLLARLRHLEPFGVLEELQSQSWPDPDRAALSCVGKFVIEEYERLKQRSGSIDFNDLERGARRALEMATVRSYYHGIFDLVLVDEFQDTNPIQAELLWRFAREQSTNLCVVGDPKQSIYRFRDADVTVFSEYCAKLPQKIDLSGNFRSRPALIDFINHVCEPVFESSGLTYTSLIAQREESEDSDPLLWLDLGEPEQLGHWLKKQGPLEDFALLLRKIRGNEKWLQGLMAAGIPLLVGSGGLFWEDVRVREICALLKWWDYPGNTLSGVSFLRAPWVAVSDEQLDQWILDQRDLLEAFLNLDHPLAEILKPLRRQTVSPSALLLELLKNPKVESELGVQVLSLWHRLEEWSQRGMDFSGCVRELNRALQRSARERELPPPKLEGQLTVLTLHGAKGLEFKKVILVDFAGKTRTPDSPLLYWDRKRGAYLGKREISGERLVTAEEKVWKEQERVKNLEESKRLFYVALTRAQDQLVLVHLLQPEKEKEEDFSDSKIYTTDYWRAWVQASVSSLPRPPRIEVLSSEKRPPQPMVPPEELSSLPEPPLRGAPPIFQRVRHSVTEWNLFSQCPRAYEWKILKKKWVPQKKERGSAQSQSLPLSASELGSRIHQCLEKGDDLGLKDLEKEIGSQFFSADQLIAWAQQTPLMKEVQSENGKVWKELAFEIPVLGEVLVGAIDRLVYSPESDEYSIVDFKFTLAPKSARDLKESYRFQMELYAWAIGMLEPKAIGRVKAFLVQIGADTPSVIEVSLPTWVGEALSHERSLETDRLQEHPVASRIQDIQALLRRYSTEPFETAVAIPKPGRACRFCDFNSICDVAEKPATLAPEPSKSDLEQIHQGSFSFVSPASPDGVSP